MAVLREVKYLLIRNQEEIPQSANDVFAANDTLLLYVANLDLTVAWYNKIRETVLEVEYPIIEGQLDKIDTQLRQAEKDLNWTSEGWIFSAVLCHTYFYLILFVCKFCFYVKLFVHTQIDRKCQFIGCCSLAD